MKKLLIGIALLLVAVVPAQAQRSPVVAACGTQSLTVGGVGSGTYIDQTGNLCTNATGGGGGAITAASGAYASGSISSGAVASGAVASGAVASGALAVGAGTDGWDATQGAKADGACATATGTCSMEALVKYLNNSISADPCGGAKSGAVISLTGSGQILAGTSAKKTYICSFNLISATAQNIALVEGTGSTCATNIFGLAGGTTAATGWNLAANGGLTEGAGVGTVFSPSGDTNAAAANVCLLLSGSGQTSGHITYVQQ